MAPPLHYTLQPITLCSEQLIRHTDQNCSMHIEVICYVTYNKLMAECITAEITAAYSVIDGGETEPTCNCQVDSREEPEKLLIV